jgi:sulfatase maturation enzyme AslB (radical SAM superfamily)
VLSTIAYARRRAAGVGKEIDFSLTTNATPLKPDVIEFLADEPRRRDHLD